MLKIQITDMDTNKVLQETTCVAVMGTTIARVIEEKDATTIDQNVFVIGKLSQKNANRALNHMTTAVKESINKESYSDAENLLRSMGVPEDRVKEEARKFVEVINGEPCDCKKVSEKRYPPPDKFVGTSH